MNDVTNKTQKHRFSIRHVLFTVVVFPGCRLLLSMLYVDLISSRGDESKHEWVGQNSSSLVSFQWTCVACKWAESGCLECTFAAAVWALNTWASRHSESWNVARKYLPSRHSVACGDGGGGDRDKHLNQNGKNRVCSKHQSLEAEHSQPRAAQSSGISNMVNSLLCSLARKYTRARAATVIKRSSKSARSLSAKIIFRPMNSSGRLEAAKFGPQHAAANSTGWSRALFVAAFRAFPAFLAGHAREFELAVIVL
jgi:hypothetical protein